eukprot:3777456-Amphidinium_carterae.1
MPSLPWLPQLAWPMQYLQSKWPHLVLTAEVLGSTIHDASNILPMRILTCLFIPSIALMFFIPGAASSVALPDHWVDATPREASALLAA